MRYQSTRGEAPAVGFEDAVLAGLAPDGGLYLPEHIPPLPDLESLRGLDYPALATRVMAPYVAPLPEATLAGLVERAYASFDSPAVTPLHHLDDQRAVLELWHGPTLAFKDVALQFLGQLFDHLLSERGERLNILGATSGDTGSAAIAGVRGRDAIRIFIMYPDGRTSAVQERQMTTVLDANVHNLALTGSFDDCQAILKSVLGDTAFRERYHVGAVNSVNWARVLAQVVYYVWGWLRATDDGPRPVRFAVPTGNFGDIFAGWLAVQMGLPASELVLGTNENDILARFFRDGRYQRGDVHFTVSPAMDIQVASNFERYLFHLLGRDGAALRGHMAAFARDGAIDLSSACGPAGAGGGVIRATAVHRAQTLATVRDTWQRHDYLLDPHTAVGVAAAAELPATDPATLTLCLATAHPAKFPEPIAEALGCSAADNPARHPTVDALDGLPTRREQLPADEAVVRAFMADHCAD